MLAPPFRDAGTYVLLPDRDHPPLRQRMVLMKRAGTTAAKFYDYISSPPRAASSTLWLRHPARVAASVPVIQCARLMEWTALILSLQLGAGDAALLLPASILLGRTLAVRRFPGKGVVEALVALPLVLPPTVLGFYLLVAFGARSPLGQWFAALTGQSLAFSFEGLLLASIIVNIPFAVQPIQRAFESIPHRRARSRGLLRHAAVARLARHRAAPRLARHRHRRGADVRAHARRIRRRPDGRRQHPGETRTLSIAIYDRMQAFDNRGAAVMAATLLAIALVTLAVTNVMGRRIGRRHA